MLRWVLKISLALMVLGVLSFAGLTLYVWPKLPNIDDIRDVRLQTPLRIYSHDGSFIQEIGEVKRVPIKIANIPPTLIHAVLATEDTRFYEHPGFDWRGILRAAIGYIKAGGVSPQGGASTITMQLAGYYYLDRSKITFKRKIMETYLAIKMEHELTKNQILELYLNTYYLGHRANGVGAAAQVYYGKSIDKLNLPQYAMIAGLFHRPSKVNPVTDPKASFLRRNHVLKRMLTVGYINEEQYKTAIATPLTGSLHQQTIQLEAPYVAEMVRRKIVEKYGEGGVNDGYKVYTTIRDKNQRAANHALRDDLLAYDKRHGYRGPESHFDLTEKTDDTAIEQFLATFPVIGGLRPAMITDISDKSVIAQIRDYGKVEIDWAGLKWARKYIDENHRGPEPRTASDIVKPGDIVRVTKDAKGQWSLAEIPTVEGALVSVDPNNGATLALVGGFDFNRSKYNRVTQARRQPGSSFKPFIYSAALSHGYTAATLVNDAPIVKNEGSDNVWRPQNYERGHSFGPVRLRVAITRSLNLVSARIFDDIGIDYGLKHIAKFGFDTSRMHHNLTLALGSDGITPWESATAYSVLANGGYKVNLYFIERIVDYNGNVVYQANPLTVCHDCDQDGTGGSARQPAADQDGAAKTPATAAATQTGAAPAADQSGETSPAPAQQPSAAAQPAAEKRYAPRVVGARNIYIINSMTRSVIQDPHGTGRRARVLKRNDLSGKTGTTNDQRDAWFAGYNSSIVAVAWVGFDNSDKLGRYETGARAALPMWIDYMRVALQGIPEKVPPPPPGLTYVRIDPKTGKPTDPDTPGAFFEVFRNEYAPKRVKAANKPDEVPQIF